MTAEAQSAVASKTWTCVDCGVAASYAPPHTGPAPEGWIKQSRGWLCLHCRREEVMASATSETREERRKERRGALAEFELLRDPEASDGAIAARIKTSTAIVRPVRARLREAGKLP